MSLVYIALAAWLVFAAHFLWWALAAKEEWRIVEKYPHGFRSRILTTPTHTWRHEIAEPHRERIAVFVTSLRWRYAVLFFIIPSLLVAALWRAM